MQAAPGPSIMEAFKKVFLQNYVNCSGRARRSEFWGYALIVFLIDFVVGLILGIVAPSIATYGSAVVSVVFLLPTISVQVRRNHDIGRSGWWILLNIIGIGIIINFIFALLDSQPEANEYGESPKYGNNLQTLSGPV